MPPRPNRASDKQPREQVHQQHAAPQQSFLTWVPEVLSRAVDKQAAACNALVSTLRKPDTTARALSFTRRIAADMTHSCKLVANKFTKLVRRSLSQKDD